MEDSVSQKAVETFKPLSIVNTVVIDNINENRNRNNCNNGGQANNDNTSDNSSSKTIKPALQGLGSFILNSDDEVDWEYAPRTLLLVCQSAEADELVKAGICSLLVAMLRHQSTFVLRPGLSIVNILVGGDLPQLQAVIDAKIINQVIRLLRHPDFKVKGAAVDAIKQATSVATLEQMKYLAKPDCIKSLCDLLVYPEDNFLLDCLQALQNILKAGEGEGVNPYVGMIDHYEGTEKIEEDLQFHNDSDISELAMEIIKKYW